MRFFFLLCIVFLRLAGFGRSLMVFISSSFRFCRWPWIWRSTFVKLKRPKVHTSIHSVSTFINTRAPRTRLSARIKRIIPEKRCIHRPKRPHAVECMVFDVAPLTIWIDSIRLCSFANNNRFDFLSSLHRNVIANDRLNGIDPHTSNRIEISD